MLRDRDKKYCQQFDCILGDAGVEPKPLPAESPNLNPYTERNVLTLKSECLNRLVFFGEQSLRRAASEFVVHYHEERNRQSLNNELIVPLANGEQEPGAIQRRQRSGGMLNYYYREAA